jgi:hypothetical protein
MLLLYSYIKSNIDSFRGATAPSVPGPPHYRAFAITLRHAVLGKMSDRPDNTQHSQETGIHAPAGFEPSIQASERPQTHALGRAAIGKGNNGYCTTLICNLFCQGGDSQ